MRFRKRKAIRRNDKRFVKIERDMKAIKNIKMILRYQSGVKYQNDIESCEWVVEANEHESSKRAEKDHKRKQ